MVADQKRNNECLTMDKKHRAFMITQKFCVYLLRPPNLKFG